MITLLGTKVPTGRHAKGVFEASVTGAPAPDPGPRELRPLGYHPAARCALALRQTRPGTPRTPFLEGQALAAGKMPSGTR